MSATAPPAWIEADRRHVWHPYTQMQTAPPPLPVVRAGGVYLYTADGRRLLDGISSWWVNIHGHNHPRLNRALAAQAELLAQVIFAGLTHEPAARLAAELAARAPGRLPWVFYSDDGSTAVEVALKMAYQHWRHRGEPGRTLFVAFDGAYHGDTFGAMAAGGVAAFHAAFRELFFTVRRACTPHSAAHGSTSPPLAAVLEREGERVAAVILEPMLQGAGGMLVQPPAFLREVRELTRRHGVPLIADEVLTGFGRTGRLFASETFNLKPDIITCAKALSSAYLPISATIISEAIYQACVSESEKIGVFAHGYTYSGHPVAAAVANETLKIYEERDIVGHVRKVMPRFQDAFRRLGESPLVGEVRVIGLMGAVELVQDKATKQSFDPAQGVGNMVQMRAQEHGLICRAMGDNVALCPPLVISESEIDDMFKRFSLALDDVAKALGRQGLASVA